MELNERMKQLRTILSLSQSKFAKSISMTKSAVAHYEAGDRTPSDVVISMICQIHHVRPEWLLTGDGEIFADDAPPDPVNDLLGRYNVDLAMRPVVEALLTLSDQDRRALLRIMCNVVDAYRSGRAEELLDDDEEIVVEPNQPSLDDMQAMLAQHYELQKKSAGIRSIICYRLIRGETAWYW